MQLYCGNCGKEMREEDGSNGSIVYRCFRCRRTVVGRDDVPAAFVGAESLSPERSGGEPPEGVDKLGEQTHLAGASSRCATDECYTCGERVPRGGCSGKGLCWSPAPVPVHVGRSR